MSDEDIKKFNNDFQTKINLEGVKYNNTGITYYSYGFYHHKINEYRNRISLWLKYHNVSYDFFILSSNVSIYHCEELSDELIHEFESDFDVTYGGYKISCDSKDRLYNFY